MNSLTILSSAARVSCSSRPRRRSACRSGSTPECAAFHQEQLIRHRHAARRNRSGPHPRRASLNTESHPPQIGAAHRAGTSRCNRQHATRISSDTEAIMQHQRLRTLAPTRTQGRGAPQDGDVTMDRHGSGSDRRPSRHCQEPLHHRQPMFCPNERSDRLVHLIAGQQHIHERIIRNGCDHIEFGTHHGPGLGRQSFDRQEAVCCSHEPRRQQQPLRRLPELCWHHHPRPDAPPIGRIDQVDRRGKRLARHAGHRREKPQRGVRGQYGQRTRLLPRTKTARYTGLQRCVARPTCSAMKRTLRPTHIRRHNTSMMAPTSVRFGDCVCWWTPAVGRCCGSRFGRWGVWSVWPGRLRRGRLPALMSTAGSS